MKRKIVKHGSATLTISLPSKWVKKYGIKAGESLDIEESEGSLLVKCPNYRPKVDEVFIDLSQHDVSKRALKALFKGGCDTIRIKYKNPETFSSVILPTLNEFIGFEIMKQEQNSCLVKEISGLTENTELDSLIRRLLHILQFLANDSAEALESMQEGRLNDIVQRDMTVNRAANFIRRLLNKRGTAKIKELPVIYYIVEELENLGDEYKYLCKYLLNQKNVKLDPLTLDLMKEVAKMISEFSSLYFKFSLPTATKITDMRDSIIDQIHKHHPKTKEEMIVLTHITRMTTLLSNLLGPLLTLRLPDECVVTKS